MEEQWEASLQKEILVLREILDTCAEEELCLQHGDMEGRKQVLAKRNHLGTRMKELRSFRRNRKIPLSCEIAFLLTCRKNLLQKIRERRIENERSARSENYSVAIGIAPGYPKGRYPDKKKPNGLLTLP